ncbi:MAG TPA: twin-arginine translocation signal domain-containing protein, partial [Chryseolinea sp.]|nr:twin-arginine translocation signal domain-containing protein [Chryseolinea sp.]
MKNILQQIITQNKEREQQAVTARQAEIDSPETRDNRRTFLKKTALGGITLGGLMGMTTEDTIAQTTSKVNKASNPSELKITDLRYC